MLLKEVIEIYSKFISLDKDKQNRIINAAIKEFAAKGYTNASTNEIVKEAGISKGLLFHYFKNKMQLYEFLVKHTLDVMMTDFNNKIDNEESDFFIKLKKIMKCKIGLLNEYPSIFKFLETAYLDSATEAKEIMDTKRDEILKSSYGLFENIDVSKFIEGIDLQKAINIVTWSLEGYTNTEIKKAKMTGKEIDYDIIFKEIEVYLDFFKKSLYK